MKMTWIAFYEELADVLLKYKDNRKELIKLVEKVFSDIDKPLPTLEKDKQLVDIDPFTIYGTFNKGITNENRVKIITSIKNVFGIKAGVPTDFDGIPVLNNMSATFYAFVDHRKGDEIDNLWKIFELAIQYADDLKNGLDIYLNEEFSKYFQIVYNQKSVKNKLTMGLFWIRPYFYLNLDKVNIEFLYKNKIKTKEEIINIKDNAVAYVSMCHSIKTLIRDNNDYSSFPELSRFAWIQSKEKISTDEDGFWPSLKEYNPEISTEEWIKYLEKIEIPNHPTPMKMLVGMFNLGGQASCKELAKVYGGTANTYIGSTVNMGKRVKKYFNKPSCMDEGQERFYVYMFQGKRMAHNDNSYYVYRMRPELKAALEEMNLSDIDPYYNGESETKDMNNIGIDKNTILYGPPGTGKTYVTSEYAVAIIEKKPLELIQQEDHEEVYKRYLNYKDEGLIEFVTFHQSYGYEEFIEGIKPVVNTNDDGNGDVTYSIEDGVFKKFCSQKETNGAYDENNKNKVFIIDEINRGNISKIFGELITLIETSKRLGKKEEMKATLPYSQEEFGVPDNVYILGTMNTADRSIALMDTALRRRFDFVEMMPDSEVLKGIEVDGLNISEMLDKINERITYLYDREHTIGHAFFTKLAENNDIDTLKSIFEKSVIPLLQEYFYEDYYKIQLVLGDNAKDNEYKFILDEKTTISNIFKGNVEEDLDNQDVKYTINKPAFSKIESYKGII